MKDKDDWVIYALIFFVFAVVSVDVVAQPDSEIDKIAFSFCSKKSLAQSAAMSQRMGQQFKDLDEKAHSFTAGQQTRNMIAQQNALIALRNMESLVLQCAILRRLMGAGI